MATTLFWGGFRKSALKTNYQFIQNHNQTNLNVWLKNQTRLCSYISSAPSQLNEDDSD